MSILSKLLDIHIHLWATCVHAYTFVDRYVLDMYVYFSLYMTYIYLEGFIVVIIFMFFWDFILSSIASFMIMCFTYIVYTHLTYCFLMILFSWVSYWLYRFWVFDDHVIFMFHEIYYCFIPFLKDFGLVYKFIIKLVRILHLVEFSNMLY